MRCCENVLKKALFLCLGLVMWGLACAQQANGMEMELRKTVQAGESAVEWYGALHNLRKVHPHGVSPEQIRLEQAREKVNDKYLNRLRPEPGEDLSSKSSLPTPVQATHFEGNRITGTPNDNEIAISNGGKIVSVANVNIEMFLASSPNPVVDQSLVAFAGLPAGSLVFDPRVIYDPDTDRFIVCFLEGTSAGNSYIHLGFSAGSDPFGSWHFYQLSGTNNGLWSDFPSMSVGTHDLMLTTNLVSGGNSSTAAQILQINKFDGYAGQNLNFAVYFDSNIGWHPIRPGIHLYGPEMWMARTFMSSFSGSAKLFFRKFTGPLSQGGGLSSEFSLSMNLSYKLPPDVKQKGSSKFLATNNFGVLASLRIEDQMYLAFNSSVDGSPVIFFARINMAPLNSGFINSVAWIVEPGTVDPAFPSLAYLGGLKGADDLFLLAFNYAGADHFPGNGCVVINSNGEFGPMLDLKEGTGPMGSGTGLSRWGDYTGLAHRFNNPGEVWFAGSYGQTGALTKGTWISQVRMPGLAAVGRSGGLDAEESPMPKVFPVPARNLTRVEFEVAHEGQYRARIHDMAGRLVQEFGNRRLSPGTARFTFNAANLVPGVYFVDIQGPEESLLRRKIVVQ